MSDRDAQNAPKERGQTPPGREADPPRAESESAPSSERGPAFETKPGMGADPETEYDPRYEAEAEIEAEAEPTRVVSSLLGSGFPYGQRDRDGEDDDADESDEEAPEPEPDEVTALAMLPPELRATTAADGEPAHERDDDDTDGGYEEDVPAQTAPAEMITQPGVVPPSASSVIPTDSYAQSPLRAGEASEVITDLETAASPSPASASAASSSPAASAGAAPVYKPLLPGSIVGRYAIHSYLGKRGSGALYRARDPRSGADVLLQRWLVGADEPAAVEPRGMRFLQHAREVTKLSHPNLLAFFDVGSVGPHLFTTSEFFDSLSLDRWLAQKPRKRRKITGVMVRAGRGLAALHGAGLATRDLRPTSILVGADDTVKLVDFGLERIVSTPLPRVRGPVPARGKRRAPTDSDDPPAGDTEPLLGFHRGGEAATEIDISLQDVMRTELSMAHDEHLGQVDGNTAESTQPSASAFVPPPPPSPYAPPEQHPGGGSGDGALMDQFSFCAVFYEAVSGVRPFAGDTPEAIADSARQGRITPAPAEAELPESLLRVLHRGMAADPKARYPSMDALLAEFGDTSQPSGRRRRVAVIAGAGVAVFAVGGLIIGLVGAGEDCEEPDPRLGEVWSAERRQSLARSFAASNAAAADASADVTADAIDEYTRAWANARFEVCESPEAEEPPDDAALLARRDCLDDRLRSLAALLDELDPGPAGVSAMVVERAPAAVAALPRIASCTALPKPRRQRDETARAELAALTTELARAEHRLALGYTDDAADDASGLLQRAQKNDAPGLEARAHLLAGHAAMARGAWDQADTSLRAAHATLESTAFDEVAELVALRGAVWLARAELASTAPLGALPELAGELTAARADAEAALTRAPEAARHVAALYAALALALTRADADSDDARAMSERARTALARIPDTPAALVDALLQVGRALQAQRQHGRALELFERAQQATAERHGEEHPRLLPVLLARAESELFLGHYERAQTRLERARALAESEPEGGADSAIAARALLGEARLRRGFYASAGEELEAALSAARTAYGDDDLRLAPIASDLAAAYTAQGRAEDARALLAPLLEQWAAAQWADADTMALEDPVRADENSALAQLEAELGRALVASAQFDEARPVLEHALETLEAVRGEAHEDLAGALLGLSELWRQESRAKRSRRYIERLVELERERRGPENPRVAVALTELGETLLESGRPTGAQSAFHRASEILDGDEPASSPVLARVAAGLGASELALGNPLQAAPELERALAIYAEMPGDPLEQARTQFLLGRALSEAEREDERDPERAYELVVAARAVFEELGERAAAELKRAEAWLESRQ
ncbi:tetratricopeptide repeat protein [Haliangium ochraceum]|nr:tetratricopeptide repeat protein [Haliangium ochraceum]